MAGGMKLKLSLFGESHGEAVGVTLEGFPAGMKVDTDFIGKMLIRRAAKPGGLTTPRREKDTPHIISGIYQGITTGTPITALFENHNIHSGDYDFLPDIPRPGHADFPAYVHSNGFEDLRGGGFHSGRLTLPYTFAGALALQYLSGIGITVAAHISHIHHIADRIPNSLHPDMEALLAIQQETVPALDPYARQEMEQFILQTAREGDSLGGIVECFATGIPAGLGMPYFEKTEALISSALFSIPAVKGVSFGNAFDFANKKGSEYNDPYVWENGKVRTCKNDGAGICGGMTNGMPIRVQAAFRPASGIAKEQRSISLREKCEKRIAIQGRHDPCIAIRSVPVVESAVALCLLDLLLCSGYVSHTLAE